MPSPPLKPPSDDDIPDEGYIEMPRASSDMMLGDMVAAGLDPSLPSGTLPLGAEAVAGQLTRRTGISPATPEEGAQYLKELKGLKETKTGDGPGFSSGLSPERLERVRVGLNAAQEDEEKAFLRRQNAQLSLEEEKDKASLALQAEDDAPNLQLLTDLLGPGILAKPGKKDKDNNNNKEDNEPPTRRHKSDKIRAETLDFSNDIFSAMKEAFSKGSLPIGVLPLAVSLHHRSKVIGNRMGRAWCQWSLDNAEQRWSPKGRERTYLECVQPQGMWPRSELSHIQGCLNKIASKLPEEDKTKLKDLTKALCEKLNDTGENQQHDIDQELKKISDEMGEMPFKFKWIKLPERAGQEPEPMTETVSMTLKDALHKYANHEFRGYSPILEALNTVKEEAKESYEIMKLDDNSEKLQAMKKKEIDALESDVAYYQNNLDNLQYKESADLAALAVERLTQGQWDVLSHRYDRDAHAANRDIIIKNDDKSIDIVKANDFAKRFQNLDKKTRDHFFAQTSPVTRMVTGVGQGGFDLQSCWKAIQAQEAQQLKQGQGNKNAPKPEKPVLPIDKQQRKDQLKTELDNMEQTTPTYLAKKNEYDALLEEEKQLRKEQEQTQDRSMEIKDPELQKRADQTVDGIEEQGKPKSLDELVKEAPETAAPGAQQHIKRMADERDAKIDPEVRSPRRDDLRQDAAEDAAELERQRQEQASRSTGPGRPGP